MTVRVNFLQSAAFVIEPFVSNFFFFVFSNFYFDWEKLLCVLFLACPVRRRRKQKFAI